MVRPPKNIQWWWSPQKPLKICNGLFTFLDPRYVDLYALEEDVLQRIVKDIQGVILFFTALWNILIWYYHHLVIWSWPGTPSLTSKPLLTIALKILKTIEKPLVPMVGPPKKHSMVMVQLCQNHWKTIDGNGGLKKNINHSIALKNWPSLWSKENNGISQGMCFPPLALARPIFPIIEDNQQ